MSNRPFSALPGAPSFTAIRSVGGALPADLISSIVAGGDIPGLDGSAYHLELGLSPREAANRAWTVMKGAWATYQDALGSLRPGQPTAALTRERWLLVLLRELGFGRVPTTPAGGLSADSRPYPISHLAGGDVPVHLLGWGTELDRRTPGMAGAAEQAPQAMVQRLLNTSDDYLWALLSNGSTLRLLRDSTSLVGPSYVEFDLASLFDGDLFSDFVALYLVCHESRFEPADPAVGMASCWLEKWRDYGVETGARALGALRVGVHDAIEALGTGFVSHPNNSALREALESGELKPSDFLHGLLRLVYRLLFCFVAEDRGQLLDPEAPAEAKARYEQWFSTARLRRTATRRAGDNHSDHWQALRLVLAALGDEAGCPTLGLVGAGGIFEPGLVDLDPDLRLTNRALLSAVHHLCVTRPDPKAPRRMVNYRNLGAEELGGIYEGLLEFSPKYDAVEKTFSLVSLAGSERKTSGSYYTPSSLVEKLLDTALDPLLDEADAKEDPVGALLDLKVCDPSCGSAHFLVAAGRRIARRVASIRADGAEPTVEQTHEAMYEVVSRCLYGVDINPLAAELAKVSLWLEGMAAGRPLNLLDGHVKVGNALLGATPALIADGIPNEAFTPIEGDDKKVAAALRKRNSAERAGARQIAEEASVPFLPANLVTVTAQLANYVPKSLLDSHIAKQRQRELDSAPEVHLARLLADAWCSAFVIKKTAGAPTLTQSELRAIASGKGSPDVLETIRGLSDQYKWFHWHIEFPAAFGLGGADVNPTTGWSGGFDCVIGNPPWEHVELKEQEWFSSRVPSIAEAPNKAARQRLIQALSHEQPVIYREYLASLRFANGERAFLASSGRYPLCGRGRINTYAVFAETYRSLLSPFGRFGTILPTGIATDDTTKDFFASVIAAKQLVSLYDFRNGPGFFFDVASAPGVRFCLLTLTGLQRPSEKMAFVFRAEDMGALLDADRQIGLTPEELSLLNPNTRTCPIFSTSRDAAITLDIYRRVPVFLRETPSDNPWAASFRQGLFNMSTDAGLFRTKEELENEGYTLEGNLFTKHQDRYLPLYEGKLIYHFTHRYGDYSMYSIKTGVGVRALPEVPERLLSQPGYVSMPRYWVAADDVEASLGELSSREWLLGWRGLTSATPDTQRTVMAAVIPRTAVGNSFSLIFSSLFPKHVAGLLANLNSFVLDFVARQKLGGTNLNHFILKQLPILHPGSYVDTAPWERSIDLDGWCQCRVLELTYTANDVACFASDLGNSLPPYRWDEERRSSLRAELDACFFHLYGIDRNNVDYIMGTFPVVKKEDEERFGEYRTKRLILEAYDAMAKAIETGEPFVSTLDPPPGKGPRHPARGTPPARVETVRNETVRVGSSSRETGCGHSPELGGGTSECRVCAFNKGRG